MRYSIAKFARQNDGYVTATSAAAMMGVSEKR